MVRTILSLLISALLSASSYASAAPLIYDELIDGDFPSTQFPQLLILENGINRVSGSVTIELPGTPDPGSDLDLFGITVPTGSKVTSIEYDITNTSGEGSVGQTRQVLSFHPFVGAPPPELAAEFVFLPATAAKPFSSALPLLPGNYVIAGTTLGGSGSGSATAQYTYRIEVVPEPESIPMILLAAGAFLKTRGCSTQVDPKPLPMA